MEACRKGSNRDRLLPTKAKRSKGALGYMRYLDVLTSFDTSPVSNSEVDEEQALVCVHLVNHLLNTCTIKNCTTH